MFVCHFQFQFMSTQRELRRYFAVAIAPAMLLGMRATQAQSPYGSLTPASPAWGGYQVTEPVPYQPVTPTPPLPAYTLPAPTPAPPTPSVDATTSPAWQAYPATGAPVPGTPAPTTAFPMQGPVFQATPPTGESKSLLPPGTRSGVFQKVNFTAAWIPQMDSDSLGWTDLRGDVVLGLPFFTRETPIVITPAYEAHFLDRQDGSDLPPRLHDLSIDFHHFRRLGESWIADFAVTPGLYADDHSFDSSDTLRINGRALAIYESSPEWKWVMGVTYVHGGWAKIVPVAGVVYEPNDDVEYELVFPRPKVSWRLPNSPVPGRDEYWLYGMGEFTNSIWAFEQEDGTPDTFAYRDLRLILGIEHKVIGGLTSRAEIGYVFRRQFKTAGGPGEIDLDDSFLLRAGFSY
jgi:hypothetical protein